MRFAGLVSDKGLEVPGDSPQIRDVPFIELDGANFPPVKYRGMYALAQHYGIPTRLLDWTGKPLVAAYFAAIEPARREIERAPPRDGSDRHLAVWAMQRHFIDGVCRLWSPGAVCVTAPTTSNPNLALQAGLFTLVFFSRRPARDRDIPTLDDLLRHPRNVSKGRLRASLPRPMLYKFTLPHEEARHLLHYLDLHGVNAATVYSGHRAVTDYLLEARYRARPEPPFERATAPAGAAAGRRLTSRRPP